MPLSLTGSAQKPNKDHQIGDKRGAASLDDGEQQKEGQEKKSRGRTIPESLSGNLKPFKFEGRIHYLFTQEAIDDAIRDLDAPSSGNDLFLPVVDR